MAVGAAEGVREVVDVDFLAVAIEQPVLLALMLDLNGRRPMDRGAYGTAFTSRYNKEHQPPTTQQYVDGVIGILVERGIVGTTPTIDGEDVYVNKGQQALFAVLGKYKVESGCVITKPNGHSTPRSQLPIFEQKQT
ncbi:MAG: hypothetical protein HY362_04010 [Candidatus Aenigmarchaeota archaeon]|nr:hypothetical protein [Candidatus Aenigmarchaeota archaeon]